MWRGATIIGLDTDTPNSANPQRFQHRTICGRGPGDGEASPGRGDGLTALVTAAIEGSNWTHKAAVRLQHLMMQWSCKALENTQGRSYAYSKSRISH